MERKGDKNGFALKYVGTGKRCGGKELPEKIWAVYFRFSSVTLWGFTNLTWAYL